MQPIPFEPIDVARILEIDFEHGLIHRAIPLEHPENAQQLIDTLEIRTYSDRFNVWNQNEWVFCFEEFANGEISIIPGWNHIFHPVCIQGYIRAKFPRDNQLERLLLGNERTIDCPIWRDLI